MSKLKILTIPFNPITKEFSNELIDKNITNKKIINYKVELIKKEENYYWTIFYEYEELDGMLTFSKETKQLNETEIKLLELLKEWRKDRATEKGIPPYVISKNEQLLEIVKNTPKTLAELQNINGIGEKKSKEYGKEILEIIKKFYNLEEKIEENKEE